MSRPNKKQDLLDAAYEFAVEHGYFKMTMHKVAKRVNCAHGLINYHFGTFADLKREVVKRAQESIKPEAKTIVEHARMMGEVE